ncbi:MAG: NAD(P)/FAD-dependent oxidoreductase [Acidobacteriota bacterium]
MDTGLRFDIIVVGASGAGLYAAELLARAGKRVGVFERRPTLNHSRRTLIVTEELERVSGPIPGGIELAHTSTMQLCCGGNTVEVRLGRPDPVVERTAFVRWMYDRAATAGAEVFFGCEFRDLREARAGATAVFERGTLNRSCLAREAVIGADGVASDVGRKAGIAPPKTVPIVQAEIRLPSGWDPSLTRVWFEPHHTRFFYWLIPELDGRAVVGLIGDQEEAISLLLRDFLARNGWKADAYQAARVSMHRPGLRPWGSIGRLPVYLVGDAAGQVKVTTVGGTVTGLLGAEAASRALLTGTRYAQELRLLKRELNVHWAVRWMLDRLDFEGYQNLLSVTRSSLSRFLSRNNRDRMAPVLWRMPFLEPRLALLAFQALRGKPRNENTAPVRSASRGVKKSTSTLDWDNDVYRTP